MLEKAPYPAEIKNLTEMTRPASGFIDALWTARPRSQLPAQIIDRRGCAYFGLATVASAGVLNEEISRTGEAGAS